MFDNEDYHWWFLGKRRFVKTLLPNDKKNLHILDVGCGTGGMTKFLASWGSVVGIEPSKKAQVYLRKRKIIFSPITFEKYKSRKKYDLICFFDVLYHKNIISDLSALKKAYHFIKPNGLILISDCALPYFYGTHDRVMFARQRYNLKEMENKVVNAGFTIIKSSYIYFFVFPLFVITRFIIKIIPLESLTSLPKLANRSLLAICSVEAKLLEIFNFPIGSSIIILAKHK